MVNFLPTLFLVVDFDLGGFAPHSALEMILGQLPDEDELLQHCLLAGPPH